MGRDKRAPSPRRGQAPSVSRVMIAVVIVPTLGSHPVGLMRSSARAGHDFGMVGGQLWADRGESPRCMESVS